MRWVSVYQLTYPEQNRVKLTEGTVFLCLYLSFKVRLVSHTTPGHLSLSLSLCEWTQGLMDRWVGGQQHHSRSVSTSLHQHPQADHVRTHVPENADASHRPGWALQWGTCMRTVRDATETYLFLLLLVSGDVEKSHMNIVVAYYIFCVMHQSHSSPV